MFSVKLNGTVLVKILVLITLFISCVKCAPRRRNNNSIINNKSFSSIAAEENNNSKESINTDTEIYDKTLQHFLNSYYDKYVRNKVELKIKNFMNNNNSSLRVIGDRNDVGGDDIDEQMQGDQPVGEGNNEENNRKFMMDLMMANSSSSTDGGGNISQSDYARTLRDRYRESELEERAKANWIQRLKDNILRQTGRKNTTDTKFDEDQPSSVNISDLLPSLDDLSSAINDHITEKIRSFYPSCDMPLRTDKELWTEERIMNLYFNFDYVTDSKNSNIATATLRLYRLPNKNATNSRPEDCDNLYSTEEDKFYQVSVYWYTTTLKKRQDVKKLLSDSKVISENSKWVELSVKPATKYWSRDQNYGLRVEVEDQEGKPVPAHKLFKGATCMVGSSTPKPIPTIIVDAARKTKQLNRGGFQGLFERNSTSTLYSDLQLLPTIDICTLELPENHTHGPHLPTACNLRKLNEETLKLSEKERLERFVTLPDLLAPTPKHIRHQRQHMGGKINNNYDNDPRNDIIRTKVLFTKQQLQKYNFSNFNLTTINR